MSKNLRDPMLPHGSDKCQCPTCKLYFNSTYAFDQHRFTHDSTKVRICFSRSELEAMGWGTSKTGHLLTPARKPVAERV
jgi:hypothetical protein